MHLGRSPPKIQRFEQQRESGYRIWTLLGPASIMCYHLRYEANFLAVASRESLLTTVLLKTLVAIRII
jgi:hypothetical protein